MSVSKVTIGSQLSVQSTKIEEPVPSIGDLVADSSQAVNTPILPIQDDRLFVRKSIGSAVIEKRADLDIPDEGLSLTGCRNKSGIEFGLSVDRPVALASIDVLSRLGGSTAEETKESIDQNLQLSKFEEKLLGLDYNFLMNRIKSSDETISSLQNALSSEEKLLKEKLESLVEISTLGDSISRKLDFLRTENMFREKVQENSDDIKVRFEESKPSEIFLREIIRSRSTSTSVIKKIQDAINSSTLSEYEIDLIEKVKAGSTLLDGTRGNSYHDLSYLGKTVVCCKVLSKIMAETFSRSKIPENFDKVKLPVSLTNFGSSANYLFESNDVEGASNETFGSQIGAALAAIDSSSRINELSIESFSPDKSIKNNNFDSIILGVAQGESLANMGQLESIREAYKDAENFLKLRKAVGFDSDACSPQDFLFEILGMVGDSFSTYSAGSASASIPDKYEMLDALIMSFGCRKKSGTVDSDTTINSIFRAIVLSSITDSDYVFGQLDPENYESRTESKTITQIDGETKVVTANSGVRQADGGQVTSSVASDLIYAPLEKRGFIVPDFMKNRARNYLLEDIARISIDVATAEPHRLSMFDTDVLRSRGVMDSLLVKVSAAATTLGGGTMSMEIDSRIPQNSNTFLIEGPTLKKFDDLEPYREDVDKKYSEDSKLLVECVKSYGKRKNTVGSKILEFYDKMLQKFSSEYDVKISEEFFLDHSQISKNSILDLIFECLSNCVTGLVNPILTDQRYAGYRMIAVDNPEIDSFDGRNDFIPSIIFFLLSGHESKVDVGLPIARGGGQYFVEQFEAFRILKVLRDLKNFSGDYFSTQFQSLDYGTDLLVGDYRTSSDRSNSDYLKNRSELVGVISNLLVDYQSNVVELGILKTVTSIVDSSVTNLIQLQEKSRNLKNSMTDFSLDQKKDVFECLSTTSVVSALIKNQNRKISNAASFESDYESNRTVFDVSAAKWFVENRSLEEYEKSRLVFFGLPQGFTNSLIRQSRRVDPATFELLDNPAVPNSNPNYFEAWLTSRPIQFSSIFLETRLMRFHPLMQLTQINEILPGDTFRILRGERFSLSIFDVSTRKWKKEIPIESREFPESMSSLGLTADEGLQIVDFHILDSIYKSVVRAFSGVDINEDILGTHRRAISAADADSILRVMRNDASNIIPRGSMRASEFLILNNSEFIEPLPFTRLRGLSPDRTVPSDHALLMRFLNTRAFTKATLSREVLLPSAFEKVYCGIFNPSELTNASGLPERVLESIKILNISDLTIRAVRS